MNKKMLVVGDSHINFIFGDFDIAKQNILNKVFEYKRYYNNYDINIICQHAISAYNVKNIFSSNPVKNAVKQLDKTCIVVFCFGCVDIYNHLPKYKNTEHVVKKYIRECLDLVGNTEAQLFFISPIAGQEHMGLIKEFEIELKKECITRNIDDPIVVLGNSVDYNFITEDDFGHLGRKDSDTAFKYIVSKIKGEHE